MAYIVPSNSYTGINPKKPKDQFIQASILQPKPVQAPPPKPVYGNASATSPQKQQFINSQVASPNQGVLDQLNQLKTQTLGIQSQLNTPSQPQVQPTASPAPAPAAAPARPPIDTSAYDSAAKAYVESFGESDQVKNARQKYLDFIQSRDLGLQAQEERPVAMPFITGAQASIERRSQIEASRLQGDVGLAEGSQQASQNQALARYGIEKDKYVDSQTRRDKELEAERQARLEQEKPRELGQGSSLVKFNPATGKYEEVAAGLPKTPEGFTLGKDQARYDAQGNLIAGGISSGNSGGAYVQGADPNVDAWINGIKSGIYKPSDVPDEIANQVAQGLSQQGPAVSETAKSITSLIDQLLDRNTNAISGIPSLSAFLPGTEAQRTKNLYNQLKGMLSLENRKALKGSGAISDFEAKTLERAASSLGRNLSDTDFIAELNKLKTELTSGGSQGEITTPDGLRWKQLPNGSYEQISFNSVGNTSVSIPSSSRLSSMNNNPGNLKYAGQPGATMGAGGFANFSTPQAGLKALQNQISLDASRGMTLAQFVTKYAPPSENNTSQYIQQIAAMTGATPTTRLSQINPDTLTKAVAYKESSTRIG
jgi:hypothetical protein